MSVSITTDIFCDRCGNWEFGHVGSVVAARRARAKLKLMGWKRRDHEDLCPDCAGR